MTSILLAKSDLHHNVTRRQIQKQMSLKWRNNITAANSIDLSFAPPFLDSCQSSRPNEKRRKKVDIILF